MKAFISIAALMAVAAAATLAWPLSRGRGDGLVPFLAGAVLLALSALLYASWSTWDWSGAHRGAQEPDVNAMVAKLEGRLRANPADLDGWLMLGRSYLALQRFDDAVGAYQRAVDLAHGSSVEPMLGLGEALTMQAGGQLPPRAVELFEQALQAEPANPKALLFGGFGAAARGDKAAAKRRWEALKALGPPPEIVALLDARIAGLGGDASTPAQDRAAPPDARARANVTLKLAPSLASRVRPDTALFVFAREPGAGGPPLAVKRLTTADIGKTIELSAADSMLPSHALRVGQRVTITARVSFSGRPLPAPGDSGMGPTYDVGSEGTRDLIIDRVAE